MCETLLRTHENYHTMSNEVEELIEEGESQNTEFKDSLRLKKEVGETISAFSNTRGGIILIGISDLGEVIGVEVGKRTLEELANYLKIHRRMGNRNKQDYQRMFRLWITRAVI